MKRSLINRSNYQLLTADMGKLIPIGITEALPNETVQHSTSLFIRVSPLAAPVLHPVTVRVHHFFTPTRILWPQEVGGVAGDNFEDFITGGADGENAATPPQIMTSGIQSDLMDYLGIPAVAGISVNALPIRAVNMIYNEWYRDEDLCTERALDDLTLPTIAWEKDYFTASRPFQQKGPSVTVPISGAAPVSTSAADGAQLAIRDAVSEAYTSMDASGPYLYKSAAAGSEVNRMFADLASATGANVDDVRKAFAIQIYQENAARYGSRFVEYIKRSFGARPQDARLQRPELLGAGRSEISFSEVLQTSQDPTGDPRFGVGDLYGHGIAALRSNGYRRTIPEHGYIISFMSVRPKSIYMDGIDRHWLKKTKFDYFQPELKMIGQQELYKNEVYADEVDGMETFGYQDRYSEYRSEKSNVHGEFRSTLDYWHMGRKFSSAPVLNASFVECDPTKRVYNEQTQHSLWCSAQHRMKVLSPIGKNRAPRIM